MGKIDQWTSGYSKYDLDDLPTWNWCYKMNMDIINWWTKFWDWGRMEKIAMNLIYWRLMCFKSKTIPLPGLLKSSELECEILMEKWNSLTWVFLISSQGQSSGFDK